VGATEVAVLQSGALASAAAPVAIAVTEDDEQDLAVAAAVSALAVVMQELVCVFDGAVDAVYALMSADSFPRFRRTRVAHGHDG
jgi:hypothetical protein